MESPSESKGDFLSKLSIKTVKSLEKLIKIIVHMAALIFSF